MTAQLFLLRVDVVVVRAVQGQGRSVGAAFDSLGLEVVVAAAAERPVAVAGLVAHRLALEVLLVVVHLARLLFDLVRRRGRPVDHRLEV